MQLALYGKDVNSVNLQEKQIKLSADSQLRQNSSMRILDSLPDTFTIEEAQKAYSERGFKDNAANVAISRWLKNELIKLVDKHKYEKIK